MLQHNIYIYIYAAHLLYIYILLLSPLFFSLSHWDTVFSLPNGIGVFNLKSLVHESPYINEDIE